MRYTLDQIAAFDSIVRLGSFNAAARQLNLTQPTVSLRIRELEAALGATLFVRHGSHITLTPAGETLHGYVRNMLGISQEIMTRFHNGAPLHGTLRFGTTDTFAQTCLLELIGRVEQIYPGIKISVCVDNAMVLSHLLEAGEIDVAITSRPNISDRIVDIRLGCNTFTWVASTSADLPSELLEPVDLASQHAIISARPSILHQTVLTWFDEAGTFPGRISTCNNLSVIIQMVSAGIAVGVLPVAIARGETASNRLRMLRVSPPLRSHEVSICYLKDNASVGLREIIRIVQGLVSEHHLFEA
jgi:DNA-binding transcriptional LysR family regulator